MQLCYKLFLAGALVSLLFSACEKLVDIPPPSSSIVTAQVFADSADANSALLGIYSRMLNYGGLMNGLITARCGTSADELLFFLSSGDQFTSNTLTTANDGILGLWGEAYEFIYHANASIEGLQRSPGLSDQARNHFIAEARFLRALVYFYVVNLWGDVPYAEGSDYKVNALLARTPKMQVYDSIVADLKYAQTFLDNDYSYSGGERVRATRQAATALLARVYLYLHDWPGAASAATAVIEDTHFTLEPALNDVFSVNSQEAILQWRANTIYGGDQNITHEGLLFVPYPGTPPDYLLNAHLLERFEAYDHRRTDWIDSTTYNAVLYHYPFKYQSGSADKNPGQAPTQYSTILRLAEQYLIRAEAEANGAGAGPAAAITDLNAIRNRAGLPGYAGPVEQAAVLDAIMHERQIEFFAEWGHRWLDLKRTGQIDAVLGAIKPQWKSYQQLYPIPRDEMVVNPNLTQNPGYTQ